MTEEQADQLIRALNRNTEVNERIAQELQRVGRQLHMFDPEKMNQLPRMMINLIEAINHLAQRMRH